VRLLALTLAVALTVPAGWTVGRLDGAWDRFDRSVVDWPCVREPHMRVADLPGWGSYRSWFPGGLVTVRSDAPAFAAAHEFAHHFWTVCHVERRPVGRRFLAAVHSPSWDYQAQEWFAATLTWLLTGQGRQDIRRQAAWTLEPLMGN
jgi:hypothetical protein